MADEDDEALSIVRDLISKYPHVNAKVIIGVFLRMAVQEVDYNK